MLRTLSCRKAVGDLSATVSPSGQVSARKVSREEFAWASGSGPARLGEAMGVRRTEVGQSEEKYLASACSCSDCGVPSVGRL